MRFFNTAGPVNPIDHYCLPPLERIDLADVMQLIAQKKYFVLHAPRQVGKTTILLALRDLLNRGNQYRCLYINVEVAQTAREDVARAMRTILGEISLRATESLGDRFPAQVAEEVLKTHGGDGAFNALLTQWSQQSSKPIVLLIDEIDSLIGDSLISILRQLRAGYDKRAAAFPQSVILCGVRDVRDYRIHSASGREPITGGSAFNIKAESMRLGNFIEKEIAVLYQQHTTETDQPFADDVVPLVWNLTQGQPWLVNALGYETCFRMKSGRERSQPISAAMILNAKEQIILRRETHLDQLSDKLKEPRVRRIIEPMLAGTDLDEHVMDDDILYATDLGLVQRTGSGLQIANRIYQEVIPRQLNHIAQLNLESQVPQHWYAQPGGKLDMNKLLADFQEFFRMNSEHWVERFDYKEAGPQLLLQAFLQRVINGGGRIEREYGLGRGRTDLLILWEYGAEKSVQKAVIETKIRRGNLEKVVEDGVAQTWAYMDRCQAAEGHLIVFDTSPQRAWDEKIYRTEKEHQGASITVWGM